MNGNNWNCRIKTNCHVSLVYKATLQTADASEYIGLTDNSFKTRYNNHTYSFRIEAKQSANTLAAQVWKKIAQTYPKNQVRNYQKISRLHPRPTRMQTLPLRKVLYIVKEYKQSKIAEQKGGHEDQMCRSQI